MREMGAVCLLLMAAVVATTCGNTKMKTKEYFSDPHVVTLVEAADRGDARGVAAAVAAGASPNAEGKEGITPFLFVLASSRNKTGLRALLQSGADPNRFTAGGMCPMVLAVRAEDPEFLRILLGGGGNANLKNASSEPVLQVAARDARWKNVEQLLEHGADINAVDGSSFTVLMNLVALRRYEQIGWLIEKGADVRVKTPNGTTLAQLVKKVTVRSDSPAFQWREKVIELLRERGEDVAR